MRRRLTASEMQTFMGYPAVARKMAFNKLSELEYGKAPQVKTAYYQAFPTILDLANKIATDERRIKSRWRLDMVKELDKNPFTGLSYELCCEACRENVDLFKFEKKIRRELVKNASDKKLSLLLSIVTMYNQKTKDFNKYAVKMLEQGMSFEQVEAEAKKRDEIEAVKYEIKRHCRQTLKHIQIMRSFGREEEISIEAFNIALNPKLAMDDVIYNKQVQCLYQTYNEATSTVRREKIRDLCYDYVKNVLKITAYPHPLLIRFLLIGGFVTQDTHDLFMECSKTIKANGMGKLVYLPVVEMRKERNKQDLPIDMTDKLLASLEKEFFPK